MKDNISTIINDSGKSLSLEIITAVSKGKSKIGKTEQTKEQINKQAHQTIRRRCSLWSIMFNIQGDSVARGHKLLSIKNYVLEIINWKFIYTYRERCKTGPAHNRCWNWSPFTSKHTWMRFSKFWNTFPKVSTLTTWISWRIASLSCSIVRGVFLYTLPFNRPQSKKSEGVRSGDLGGQRFFFFR